MSKKWIYDFNDIKTDGSKDQKDLLGGKGANLSEMASLGLNVPPGFTISTEACLDFENNKKEISTEIKNQILNSIKIVEERTGKIFGDEKNPLLFSIRSGARVSMPGMMDTVLNLGLNEMTLKGLAVKTGNDRFAWDSYRRFIQMYANVVMGFNTSILESLLEDLKDARSVKEDTELSAEDLKELSSVYKSVISQETGETFPDDPKEQLWKAIIAVFESWNNSRAQKYRELNNIPSSWGTAVNVQSMVFGNMGDDCATGVCFTRDPSTGDKRFFGEYLINAQGEDVVAGIRTPAPINNESKNKSNKKLQTLNECMPDSFKELTEVYQKLEAHYKDMQDIEFTIENNKLYLLQTRNGKRTAAAAIKIATDLHNEKLISKEEALMRISPEDLNQLLHPRLDPSSLKNLLTTGLPASPGAGSGEICFDPDTAKDRYENGRKIILVRHETSPEDITGMIAAEGILTARGGMTSHAAVVARGMGKPCVAGCSQISIDYESKTLTINEKVLHDGDFLTIDGETGEVFEGKVPTISANISKEFSNFMSWADEVKKLKIRANADNPIDCEVALEFGAEGIGLCRTEHMFFEPKRILAVREMIFSQNEKEREKSLSKILPFQKSDFVEMFKVMGKRPVNIRLLDPPLHEFLPSSIDEKEELAKSLGITLGEINKRSEDLFEFNPMLGHRGCRLAISYPEICRMQSKAIAMAACECKKNNLEVNVEIMVPLIADVKEFKILKEIILSEVESVILDEKVTFNYKIGTMIELPRAAITSAAIAKEAQFFSFGTNDLTQTTFGLSRDDSGKFLKDYKKKEIFIQDPFVSIDENGVGFLVELATKNARAESTDIHVGICGEHGGEPKSIDFFHRIGLDYVSCSPYRVPVARLSAAQAAIRNK